MDLNKQPEEKYFWTKMWGKKFLIFSAFLIVLTTIGVIFFDETDDEEINLLEVQNPYAVDTLENDSIK